MDPRGKAVRRWTINEDLAAHVQDAAQRRASEAWELLQTLVNIDSSPDDLAGLDQVVEPMRAALDGLGLATQMERTGGGLPVLHGLSGPKHEEAMRVLLVGHLDTVFPSGTVAERPFQRGGERATGPGVADAKGGAAAIWLALASALDVSDGLPNVDVRVLLNTDEEAGSVESRPIIEAAAPGTDLALVYEPGRPDGSIVRQRRGARRYRVRVQGKSAHTGVEPWKGVNAIEEAAHKILRLQALNDPDQFLSVTVAVIRGGSRVNVVPDEAVLDVDTRLPDAETAERTHRAVEAIVSDAVLEGASSSYEIISDRPPMMPQPSVAALLAQFHAAADLLGVKLNDTATGGGSDGCFLSPLGVPVVDALGPVGGGYHTKDEFLSTPTLVERAMLSALVLAGIDAAE
jgi:glutamate carboxypeptidase